MTLAWPPWEGGHWQLSSSEVTWTDRTAKFNGLKILFHLTLFFCIIQTSPIEINESSKKYAEMHFPVFLQRCKKDSYLQIIMYWKYIFRETTRKAQLEGRLYQVLAKSASSKIRPGLQSQLDHIVAVWSCRSCLSLYAWVYSYIKWYLFHEVVGKTQAGNEYKPRVQCWAQSKSSINISLH